MVHITLHAADSLRHVLCSAKAAPGPAADIGVMGTELRSVINGTG